MHFVNVSESTLQTILKYMRHRIIKPFLLKFIFVIIIVGLVYYLYSNIDILVSVFDATFLQAIGISVCILSSWFLNSLQILILIRKMGVKIGLWENLCLFIATAIGNYIPMKMGTIIRMRYLKEIHGFNYTTFTGLVWIRALIFFLTAGLLGCIGIIGLRLSGAAVSFVLFYPFLMMLLISGGFFIVPIPKFGQFNSRYAKHFQNLLAGIDALKNNRLVFFLNMILVLTQYLLLAIRLYFSFQTVNVNLSLWALLVLAPTTTLITFISITPGSLGIREWVIGLLSFGTGVDFQNGIFAGTIDRAFLMGYTFTFGIFALIYIHHRLSDNDLNKLGIEK